MFREFKYWYIHGWRYYSSWLIYVTWLDLTGMQRYLPKQNWWTITKFLHVAALKGLVCVFLFSHHYSTFKQPIVIKSYMTFCILKQFKIFNIKFSNSPNKWCMWARWDLDLITYWFYNNICYGEQLFENCSTRLGLSTLLKLSTW